MRARSPAAGEPIYLWEGAEIGGGGIVGHATLVAANQGEWRQNPEGSHKVICAVVDRWANKKQMIQDTWIAQDPVLGDLRSLDLSEPALIGGRHEGRLSELWLNTGADWDWRDSIAALWAYEVTRNGPVSRRVGTPVSNVALAIGRAIPGVYNKIMNFRALDTRDERAGLDGAGETDRKVWKRLFDQQRSTINLDMLHAELRRLSLTDLLRGGPIAFSSSQSKLTAPAPNTSDLPHREEAMNLVPRMPATQVASVTYFVRSPLIAAFAKQRANNRCEIPGCTSKPFASMTAEPFTETHHIIPLSEGGEDTADNTICLCPNHHREAHFGAHRMELRRKMQVIRSGIATPLGEGSPD